MYSEPKGFKGTEGEWNYHATFKSEIKQFCGKNEECAFAVILNQPDVSKSMADLALLSNAKELAKALEPFVKLAEAVLIDTLKTNEQPLYAYNDATIYVKDLSAAKAALAKAII